MRYWVYEDDRLAGPYSADELRERPRFGEETLVIAEDRLDAAGGRWRRAADVPGLALVLSERGRRAFANSLRPPEPAVRDLSILGSLLEQVERIEGVLVGMRDELKKYQAEADKLWDDGKAREARAAGLDETNAKIVARMEVLEALQGDVAALRAELAAAQESRAGLEQRLSGAMTRLAEATSNLDAARGAQAALASELVEVRTNAAETKAALEASQAETTAWRAQAEARARADAERAERAAKALAALDAREGERWLWGSARLSPQVLAGLGLAAGLLAVAALVLGIRAERRARGAAAAPPPPAAPAPVPPPPAPEPAPAPVVEPAPAPPPAPPRRPTKAQARAEEERRLKASVLLRATGGVPSSNKALAKGGLSRLADSAPAKPAADEPEPQALVLNFLAPSPAPGMCPRGLDELVAGDGGPARTPQEALECWTWSRVGAAADALAKGRKIAREEALADLQVDAMGWGGFGKLFPLDVKSERTEGRVYKVVLTRRDLLAEKLATRYKLKKLTGAETSLSYEADVAERSVRPLDAASWRVLDSAASNDPLPAPAYKR